jgi:hypothetical protein
MLLSCWELLIWIPTSRRVWYPATFYVTISWNISGGIQNENAGWCVPDASSKCYFLTSRIPFPKAQEVASGVQYLHEHGVVHGDLKAVCARFVLESKPLISLRTMFWYQISTSPRFPISELLVSWMWKDLRLWLRGTYDIPHLNWCLWMIKRFVQHCKAIYIVWASSSSRFVYNFCVARSYNDLFKTTAIPWTGSGCEERTTI